MKKILTILLYFIIFPLNANAEEYTHSDHQNELYEAYRSCYDKLYYKDQYAGTTDLVGMYRGVPHIIDFKQTNKPKQEKWIQDYYLQLTAYAHAHNYMTGTDIKNGVVLMCCRDLSFQKFELNEIKFEKYSYMWFNRVKEYQKIITESADS